MNAPLISVIIPVYNVEQYLDECIQSIRCQTYSNLEIILVDDGSPDNCPAICDELAQQDERIIVIHKKNEGVSSARNAGLDKATGEFVAFVDSDDWIAPDMYSKLVKILADNPSIGIAASVMWEIEPNGSPSKAWNCVFSESRLFRGRGLTMAFVTETINIFIWNKLFRRRLIGNLRFLEGSRGEDMRFLFDLSWKMDSQDVSLYELPQPLYYYRHRPGSLVSQVPLQFRDQTSNFFYYYDTICMNKGADSHLANIMYRRYIATLVLAQDRIISGHWSDRELSWFRNQMARQPFHKMWRVCGMRHRLALVILHYVPLLWRIDFIRSFCTRND